MNDIPAGWLAVLSPVIAALIGGFGWFINYLVSQIKERDAIIARLGAELKQMQEATIAALNRQLEASLKGSNVAMSMSRTVQEQARVIEQVAPAKDAA